MTKIYPSLIAADLLRLKEEIRQLQPYCDGFHLDVMDNHFVPNLTFGADIVNAVSAATTKQLWVHLMVDNPISWCNTLTLQAESIVSFHIEATKKAQDIIKQIKENNWRASIAIKPKTPVAAIFPLLNTIDQVLLMSVEPGFSGQQFLPSVVDKIEPLITYRKDHGLSFAIGIDGGINQENIGMLATKGVEDFAVAAAIFDQPDPVAALKKLRKVEA